ncbi:hypothetical protein QAD02_003860 [Eretmocerus hayati]|uniref:Uncharacterized protein n=1 Tax=Eretmocerus hayati TaxID=131215 RepID=A0ACC2NNW8_9HYME|nr:hypothetical protein QAD02_003860 [Eretmocerus hayati]
MSTERTRSGSSSKSQSQPLCFERGGSLPRRRPYFTPSPDALGNSAARESSAPLTNATLLLQMYSVRGLAFSRLFSRPHAAYKYLQLVRSEGFELELSRFREDKWPENEFFSPD